MSSNHYKIFRNFSRVLDHLRFPDIWKKQRKTHWRTKEKRLKKEQLMRRMRWLKNQQIDQQKSRKNNR
jgi:hypothetical protein